MGGPQENRFEQVSSIGHQMSLAGVGAVYSKVSCQEGLTVRFNALWVMVTWVRPRTPPTQTPDRMTDRKHLLATSLAHCMNEVFVDSVEKNWDLQHHIWLAVDHFTFCSCLSVV